MADLLSWLVTADPAEILSLPVDMPIGFDIRELPVSRGAQLLIRNWQRVGRSTCWTVSKWNNANQGLWSESVKQNTAENVLRIRHWQILCGDYQDLPNTEATWFVDPPYQHVPPAYRRGEIDCNTVNFGHLADWCQSRTGQVIVCEQAGADWLPFREFRDLKAGTAGARGKSRADKGVIWTNDTMAAG